MAVREPKRSDIDEQFSKPCLDRRFPRDTHPRYYDTSWHRRETLLYSSWNRAAAILKNALFGNHLGAEKSIIFFLNSGDVILIDHSLKLFRNLFGKNYNESRSIIQEDGLSVWTCVRVCSNALPPSRQPLCL